MPRKGGALHMVARLPANVPAESAEVAGFQIIGDAVAWWGHDRDIWRVPLSGGRPEPVLPDRNLRVSSWPWAYDEYGRTVVNLDTGQETQVTGADDMRHRLACGPVWCVGEDWQQPWKVTRATVLRVDGSERTTVPGDALLMRPPIRDRLALLGIPTVEGDDSVPGTWGAGELGPVVQLFDRCTGRTALLGSPEADGEWNDIKTGAGTPDGPILYWRATQNRYTILDLARIAGRPCASTGTS
jgi:hypothetical protein